MQKVFKRSPTHLEDIIKSLNEERMKVGLLLNNDKRKLLAKLQSNIYKN